MFWGQAMKNWGQLAKYAGKGGFGGTITGGMYGAVGGAAWGAVSDDTSMLGGALMGATAGALGAGIGGSGGPRSPRWRARKGRGSSVRTGPSPGASGMSKASSSIASNKGFNSVPNILRRGRAKRLRGKLDNI